MLTKAGRCVADPYKLFNYLIPELNKFKLLYVHMVEPRMDKNMNIKEVDSQKVNLTGFRKAFKGTFIAAGGCVLCLLLQCMWCGFLLSSSSNCVQAGTHSLLATMLEAGTDSLHEGVAVCCRQP